MDLYSSQTLTCCHKYLSLSQTCTWAESPGAPPQTAGAYPLCPSSCSAVNDKPLHQTRLVARQPTPQKVRETFEKGSPGLCSTADCNSGCWCRSEQSEARGLESWSWDLRTRTPALVRSKKLRTAAADERSGCSPPHLWSITLGVFLQSKVCVSMMYSNSSTLSKANCICAAKWQLRKHTVWP